MAGNGEPGAGPVDRSIVIPVHNRAALTCACLDALSDQGLEGTEVIVVDDASTERIASTLSPYFDRIRLIRRDRQGGFGAACNDGVAEARGRYLVLLNNDTIPTSGWLDALAREAERHPEAAIVGAKLLWPDNTVQHAGVVIDGERNARHVYAGFPADHPAVSHSRPFQVVTGAAMLVRREAFDALGGFDTAFANGWEDVDFCLRAGQHGLGIRYCHEAVLYHLEGGTRGVATTEDLPNWRLFRQRWAERLKPDDLTTYAEDRLLEMSYREDGDVRLEVAPELGGVRVADGNELLAALAEQSRRSFALRQESNQLARQAHEAPVRWRRLVRRQASPSGGATVSVVVYLGDEHDCHEEFIGALANQSLPPDRYDLLLDDPRENRSGEGALHDAIRSAEKRIGIRYHRETRSEGGRAAALNRAIRESRGDLVLLLADDFIPRPELVEEHLAAHEADLRPNLVALGPAFFPEELRANRFRRWLEDSGELFGHSFTTGDHSLPPTFFYSANVSLKREFLLGDELFDERLPLEAWDDYELGMRLYGRGMDVVYVPGAAATHEHAITLSQRYATMRNAGRSAATFDAKYPSPHRWNTRIDPSESLLALRLEALAARARTLLLRREKDYDAYHRATLRRAFLQGYRETAWGDGAGR